VPVTGERWGGLDGLRGLAVVSVVLFHSGVAPGGFAGVDVFFVLSGFLITRILRGEVAVSGTIRLRRFAVRRLLRLYPALLVVCVFVLGLAVILQTAVVPVSWDVLTSLTYTSNLWSPTSGLLDATWTLSIEEQFYLIWPALLLVAVRIGRWWAWTPVALLLGGVLIADLATGGDTALHTYVRAMGLPLGCALAFAGPRTLRALGRIALLAGLAFVASLWLPLPEWLTEGWPVSIGAVLAVPMVAALVTWRVRWMGWAPLRYLGLRSYSLYLWHMPLIALAWHHGPEAIPLPLRIVAGVIASLIAAELSYRCVEQPVLRVRPRLTARI
jgi:peptidoglycan/LPS O-acetylase OafA/YrhL